MVGMTRLTIRVMMVVLILETIEMIGATPVGIAPIRQQSRHRWKTTEDLDNGVPTQVQWRLQTSSDGLVLGDDTLVPGDTKLYFNAKADFDEDTGALRLYDGRITVKEDLGANVGIFAAKGILAEFKIVGTFVCKSGRATD